MVLFLEKISIMLSRIIKSFGNIYIYLKSWAVRLNNKEDSYATYAIMVLCTLIHFSGHGWAATFSDLLAQPFALIGYIVTHPTFAHLFSNMMFLLLFGPAVERYMKKAQYLTFFLLCGILSGVGFLSVYQGALLVGASGAISGLIAVYPLVQRTFLSRLVGAISCSAYFWIQLTSAIIDIQTNQIGVAHLGHLLGGVIGLLLFNFFKTTQPR